MTNQKYNLLIFGASYGSLLATKLALAGHHAQLVCLQAEVDLINTIGTRIRMPIRGHEGLIEIDSNQLKGKITAKIPTAVDPAAFDLVVLAMQEPQYRASGVRELLDQVARSKIPTMSIMNMPPLPFLARIPSLNTSDYRNCYIDPTVWDSFDPALMTLCSPDAQAFRPPDEPINVLQVRLPTNFKAARFKSDEHTNMLRELQSSIEAIRFHVNGNEIELPVKLKVFDSVFVPLAKWSMLIAGNYRCIHQDGMRSIKDAIHSNLEESRRVYDWVGNLCKSLGASNQDLVPFDKYAAAANGLASPSSAARALYGGAPYIERVDLLVQTIAKKQNKQLDVLDQTVKLVNEQLTKNRDKKS